MTDGRGCGRMKDLIGIQVFWALVISCMFLT